MNPLSKLIFTYCKKKAGKGRRQGYKVIVVHANSGHDLCAQLRLRPLQHRLRPRKKAAKAEYCVLWLWQIPGFAASHTKEEFIFRVCTNISARPHDRNLICGSLTFGICHYFLNIARLYTIQSLWKCGLFLDYLSSNMHPNKESLIWLACDSGLLGRAP